MLEQYVHEEVKKISRIVPSAELIKTVRLEFSSSKFFKDFKRTVTTDRRGEVGFVVRRGNGRFVVVRSKRYPKNTFRIPTGGINFSETALEALKREVAEELGISFEIECFIGLLEYYIVYKGETLKFYSYLFLLRETGGEILKDASENEVSAVKEITSGDIASLKCELKKNEIRWKDWSKFRLQLLEFFEEYISKSDEGDVSAESRSGTITEK